jgi:hypothetical protein
MNELITEPPFGISRPRPCGRSTFEFQTNFIIFGFLALIVDQIISWYCILTTPSKVIALFVNCLGVRRLLAISCKDISMRDLISSLRTRILIECAKRINPATRELVHGAVKEISIVCEGVSPSTIKRISRTLREMAPGDNLTDLFCSQRKRRCGRHSKLTPELRVEYLRIFQEYANAWMRLSVRMLRGELITAGHPLSTATIHAHLKLLHARKKKLRIKPKLTVFHKEDRARFILDAADRNHGLDRPNHFYQDQFDTIHVDESWFYLERITNEIWLIDGVVIPDTP